MLHIRLTDNRYLCGDKYQYWIQQETPYTTEKGQNKVLRKELTMNHFRNVGDSLALERCFDEYFERHAREAELDGEIKDLLKFMKKTRKEMSKWASLIAEQLGDME